ncbi:MAG: hypothetical protein LC799_24040 [Actinobacteria bacterium]|nr:hypothetical protein [Actinomycetota bacterium]
MSTTPAHGGEGFHVVVADDGSLPASELARLGLRPGAHLRIVPEQRSGRRKSMLGALAGTLPPEAVDDLIRGLDEAKAERTAYFAGENGRESRR